MMGGRGRSSRLGEKQMNMEDYEFNCKVEGIMEKAEALRSVLKDTTNQKGTFPLRKCCCCEKYMVPVNSFHWKCKECGWIDDEFQNVHPDSTEGPNPISLNEARKWYNNIL